ncbi:MAG: malate synthase A, partial [Roseiflexus sp.]|nr:malate synthase A [Roseiflexus sp.]
MDTPYRVEILGPIRPEWSEILTVEALDFVASLARQFEHRRRALLAARDQRWADIKSGALPDFLPETVDIRSGDWKVASIPADFSNRRVEITGPTDRRMVINALNSGAQVFMADFEDANAPTWENIVQGQLNLRDAVRRTITF